MQKDSVDVRPMGPTMVLLWVWGWVSFVPKTVAGIYSDLKSGKLLSRFTFLDAMMQFLVAVATSCHPQDDGSAYGDVCEDEVPADRKDGVSKCGTKVCDGVDVFGGTGQTLRSRIVETET